MTSLNLSDAQTFDADVPDCRILYLRGGILEATDELSSVDVVSAAKAASAKHPHLTAEIWLDGRKAAVVRPSCASPIFSLPRSASGEIQLPTDDPQQSKTTP
jgi:hypothetical protein